MCITIYEYDLNALGIIPCLQIEEYILEGQYGGKYSCSSSWQVIYRAVK